MFILASASERRKQLLAQIGVVPDKVCAPDVDETPFKNELPRLYCMRIALHKLNAIPSEPRDIVLCADTIVALGRRIIGKPRNAEDARKVLLALAGRRHKVMTAVVVRCGERVWQRLVISQVKMKPLSEYEIAGYLSTNDWHGKAGAYAIQGPAAAFIPWISGSFSAIVGLPLSETARLLEVAGYPIWKLK